MRRYSRRLFTAKAWLVRMLSLIAPILLGIAVGFEGVLAQDATPTSITLHWTAPGDDDNSGTASEYDIRYATSPISEANWNSTTQITGEPFPQAAGSAETFTVDDLEPSTTYYFAIMTADEVPNWSELSNIIIRTTLDEEDAPGRVSNLAAGNATVSNITLTWTAPGDDGDIGTASEYDIRYSTSPISDANWNSATQATGEPSPQTAGSAESFTITALNASTVYFFAIKTADEIPNWSILSNVTSRSTLDEQTPPVAIADLAIDSIGGNGIKLVWTAPGDDGDIGTASEYDIRYSISPISEANWNSATQATGEPSPQVAGSAESFVVEDLDPSITYYFAVKTADEVPNWSELSNVVNATTLDNVSPAAIMDLSAVTGDEAGELDLNWTAPGDDGNIGIASYYLILYSTEAITIENWEEADYCVSPPDPLPAGASQTFILTDLEPGCEYWVAMKAYDEALNGAELSNIVNDVSGLGFILDIDDEFADLPDKYNLAQNYPNPFNPSTTIEYSVPVQSQVTISIYNTLGQLTSTVVDETQSPGHYTAIWDGTNSNGQTVASGVYMYRIQAGDFSQSKKMLLLQ